MNEELERAARERSQVEIVVSDCWFGCCGRSPTRRVGYEQTYRGVIVHLADDKLLLHAIGIGTLNYQVVCHVDNVEAVRVDRQLR